MTAHRRFLALGDSYTIGEAVPEPERWPNQLADLLRAAGGLDLGKPRIIATTGWTTSELAAAITAAKPAGTFDLVTLLIGVNNQYRGLSIDEYREEFAALLETAIRFAGRKRERVIVLSIPDWGVTPFAQGRDRAAIAREIDAFNAVNREAAHAEGAHYIDLTPVSREAARDASLIAPDGLHPSGEMYRRWAELLAPAVVAAFA